MDQLRRRNVEGIARAIRRSGLVGEAHADRQQHVRLRRQVVAAGRAVAAHVPPIQRMRFGKGALALHRADDGGAQMLCQLLQLAFRIPQQHAPTYKNHRTLCLRKQLCCPSYRFGISARCALRTARRRVGQAAEFDVRRLHIHRQGDHSRARAAGQHRVECLAHCPWQLAGLVDAPTALNDAIKDARKVRPILAVNLLQYAHPTHMSVRLADQQEQRNRIDIRSCQTQGGVGRAGSDRGVDCQWPPACAKIAVGHVHGRLLVARHDDLDFILATAQSVDERQVAVAGDANGISYTLAYQHFDDDFGAVQLHCHVQSLPNSVYILL